MVKFLVGVLFYWHVSWLGLAFGQSAATSDQPILIGRIVLAPGLKVDLGLLAKMIYPDVADADDTAFSLKINLDLLAKREKRKQDNATVAVRWQQLAGEGDAVLRQDRGEWELLRASEDGRVTSLGKAPGELELGPALRQIMGYDGVVVAQDGRTVFAQTPDLSGRSDLYAVAVAASEGRLVVRDDEKVQRSALLRLLSLRKVEGHGTIATFRVVSAVKMDPLPIGTKIRIEKWQ